VKTLVWWLGTFVVLGVLIFGAGWLEANVNVNTFGWIIVGAMFVILFLILLTNAYLRKYKEEEDDIR
jgi:uncharacterized membrane protein (DUF485 family)